MRLVRPAGRPSSGIPRATHGRPPAPNGRAPVGQSAQAACKYIQRKCVFVLRGQSHRVIRTDGAAATYTADAHCTYCYYIHTTYVILGYSANIIRYIYINILLRRGGILYIYVRYHDTYNVRAAYLMSRRWSSASNRIFIHVQLQAVS